MTPDEQAAESSTALDVASDQALADRDFTRYSAIENARDAGKPPPEAPAPSTEKTETTPASEPGTEKEIQETKPKPGAKERKVELNADIQDLLKRRAELRAEVEGIEKPGEKKTDPPPVETPKPKAAPATAEAPIQPELKDFKTFAEYDVADKAHTKALIAYTVAQALAADRAAAASEAENKAHDDKWQKQVTEAKEEHADFADVAFSKSTPITPVMDGFILESEHGARVLYKLGENDSAEGKRIAALPAYAAVRALVTIETALTSKKAPPPVKKHTAAPPPATNLVGGDSDISDPVEAALNAGDVPRYIALANARDRKNHTAG